MQPQKILDCSLWKGMVLQNNRTKTEIRLFLLMSHSKVGENETVEDLRNEDDRNEDTADNVCDNSSKKRSWVWNHFIEEKNSEGSIAKCKYCKKVLSGSTKGGTSHLKRHLENVCKKYQKNPTNQLLLLPSSKDPIKCFKFNQEESRKILAKFIICAKLPFRIVEHTVFLDFMKSSAIIQNYGS
ncbi:uncharacterized protein LOC120112713 [Phoenix dactylifera]|uniref:Uncharacterized protein LOC120112713 n=1 Tax=Phoenix dactylifera TaxID=42345 RepID=A0A8B9AN99_PHODC|nr:uncharacterized protein LOC120112713 [Phoenix dactylifera]